MQVILHAGAHMTDEDRLLDCLSADRELLARNGTHVPNPSSYRKLMRNLLHSTQITGETITAREQVLNAIVTDDMPERIVLSNASFFGTPKMAASGGELYSAADTRLLHFQKIFPSDQLELFLAIRNPASFLPAIFSTIEFDSMADYLRDADPRSVRWSDLISRIRSAFPDLHLTIWCNEDTPLIWSEILREMGGLDPTVTLKEEFSLMTEIMSASGMQRFYAYLDSHPGMTESQKRRVIAAFLDKFADESAIEEELDVPGWTEDLIEEMTELYDEDVLTIQRIPGVKLITP